MHYDVEGNLDINIKDFEEHIKQAEEKLKNFEKNFKKLAEIKSSNQMETLVETVQKIREELKGASTDGQKLDESFNDVKQSAKGADTSIKEVKNTVEKTKEEFKKTKKEVEVVKEEITTLDGVITKTEKNTERLEKKFNDLSAPLFVLEDAFSKISNNTMVDVLTGKLDKVKARMNELRTSVKSGIKELTDVPTHQRVGNNISWVLRQIEKQKEELAKVPADRKWGYQRGLGQKQKQLKEEFDEVNGALDNFHIREMAKEFAELKEEARRLEKELGKLGEKADTAGTQFDGTIHKFESRFGEVVPRLQKISDKSTESLDKITDKAKTMVEKIKESFESFNSTIAKSSESAANSALRNIDKIDEQSVLKLNKIRERMAELSTSMYHSKLRINEENKGYKGYSYNLNKIRKEERWAYYDDDNFEEIENLKKTNAEKKKIIDQEIASYKTAREELLKLKKEYSETISSPSSVDHMLVSLEHLQVQSEKTGQRIVKLREQLDKALEKRDSSKILSDEWSAANNESKRIHGLLQNELRDYENFRSQINTILKGLVNDYNVSFKEIEAIINTPLKPIHLTESLNEVKRQISVKTNELERAEKLVKDLMFKYELNQSSMSEKVSDLSKYGKRRKDGELKRTPSYKNLRDEIKILQEENEKILSGKYEGIAGHSGTNLQKARENVQRLKNELIELDEIYSSLMTSSNFSGGAVETLKFLEQQLEKTKASIKSSVDFIRNSRNKVIQGDDSLGIHQDMVDSGVEILKSKLEAYRELQQEIETITKGMAGEFDKAYEKIEEKSEESTSVQKTNLEELLESFQKVSAQMSEINSYATENPLQWSSEMKQLVPVLEEIAAQFMEIEHADAQNIGKGILENIKLIEKELNKVSSRYDKIVELDMTYKKASGVGSVHNVHNFGVDFVDMQRKATDYFNNLAKPAQEGLSRFTNMWVHEQITQFNEFARAVQKAHDPIQIMTTDFSKLQTSASTNTWVHEQITQFNEFARAVQKAHKPLVILSTDFSKIRTSASTNVWVHEQIVQFNEFARAVQKAHEPLVILTTDFDKLKTSASTNVWVHEQITQFNEFAKAVQETVQKAESGVERLNKTFAEMKSFNLSTDIKNTTGMVSLFDPNTSKVYSRNAELAARSSYKLEESLTSMGSASETAGSRVSTLGGILRTLRTTMSMIGGMFVWDFAFKILDATKATIAAKSEMESFFVTLKMGANDISHFNTMLDDTIRLFPKMNKFQLGETISSLGLEFNLNTDEMAQIAKVAPMIVNEYLRAGRKTEEAILAIKDISQGEFLRLSRETGVGKEELKAAGWNGDNKDILNLYEALEKVGKGRHWDAFASKATSINDVMLITENRMTEFATMISDWFTPIIVNSFNMLGSTFEGSRKWLENLSPLNQSIVTVTGAIVGMGAAVWGMESKVVPALKNVGSTILSNALGIDKAILQTYGLSSAIAQQTIVEKARNIAMAEGNVILDQKIRKGIAEAEASKLGMEATELQAVYEKLYADTLAVTRKEMALTDAETKSRKLTQEALLLAEKENITVEEAHALIMEREQIANMGALKSLVAYKLGLDMSIAANEGLITAIGVKIGIMEVEETVTGTVTTLNWALLASYTALLAPLALVAAAVVLLVADFMDLCKSYDEFNDRLTNGADKIDELKKKEEAYTATVNELENKTNRTSKETEKLEEAREGLRYTTKALERTEQEYYKSLAVSNYWEDTHTKTMGKRQEATEKRLKELAKDNKLSENTYLDEYNTSLTRAEQATYDATQAAAWRAENYRKELEEFSDPKLVAKFKNATDAYEEAKYKMSAPDSDMMTRAWSHVDTWSIGLQIEGIKFENDPKKWVSDFLTDNSSVFDQFREEMQRQSLTMNNPVIDVYGKMLKSSFDGMINDWTEWGTSTNQWIDSIMPKFTVDGFKNWFGKNVREPFQKAFSDFIKNPLGNGGEEKAQSGTATKTLSLKTMFNFDFPSFKMDLVKGFTDTFSATTPIFQVVNTTWKALGLGNGKSFTDSVKQGLGSLKDKMSTKLREGGNAIKNQASTWKTYAHNAGKGIYDRVKNGIGDIGTMIKNKLDEVTTKLKNIKDDWIGAAKEAASGLNPLNYVDVPFLTGGGLFGYAGGKGRANVKRSNRSLKISRPVYGSSLSNAGFEQTLGGLLTAQGFRKPSSYQYYPNSMKSVQETWDSGKSNCLDGAALILNLANMMGMKGHIVTGTWNGQGHAAAKIGGKLYDMTQFQKRGVFRGTSGVHFGGGSSAKHYGTSTNNVSRDMNITINLGGSTIYGMSDFKDKMEKVAEDVFIKYHDENPAIGV